MKMSKIKQLESNMNAAIKSHIQATYLNLTAIGEQAAARVAPNATADAIKAEYAPYDKMPEFTFGMFAYNARQFDYPKGFTGVQQQAFDRGLEAAMKIKRAARAN